jgi:hypothetical protein
LADAATRAMLHAQTVTAGRRSVEYVFDPVQRALRDRWVARVNTGRLRPDIIWAEFDRLTTGLSATQKDWLRNQVGKAIAIRQTAETDRG